MANETKQQRVVEKYYSARELGYLLGFNEQFWRQAAQAGDLTLVDDSGAVIAQPALVAGELRIPASAVNAYLARRPYRYDAGVKARNKGELLRKLNQQVELEATCE